MGRSFVVVRDVFYFGRFRVRSVLTSLLLAGLGDLFLFLAVLLCHLLILLYYGAGRELRELGR